MPQFDWEGQTDQGEFRRGVMEGKNAADVESRLRQIHIQPSRVKRKARDLNINIPFFNAVKLKTLVVFTRQLATMIDAGLPLVQCLEILGQQEPDKNFQKVIENVRTSVESGSTFADALARHPKVFDELYCNLVGAGEMGGILDTILNRLASYAEKAAKLRARVKGAMKYPLVVLFVAIGVTALMLVKVIPTFAHMFKSMGKRELPEMTRMVMAMSDWTREHFLTLILIIVGLIVGFTMFKRWPPGRKALDTVLLRLPVFGNLLRKSAVAKFTRTLGTLIASGVPILDSLDIVGKTAGNKVVEEAIMYTRERISEGKNIAGPLMETRVFPQMVVQMIGVGESTGAMDIMLSKIADFYDDEVDEGGRVHHLAHRADDDGLHRWPHRLPPHRHVHAHLRHGRQHRRRGRGGELSEENKAPIRGLVARLSRAGSDAAPSDRPNPRGELAAIAATEADQLEQVDTLVRRLKVIILIRVVLVTLMGVSTLSFDLQGTHAILAGRSQAFVYTLATLVYILSVGYTLTLRFGRSLRSQHIHAAVQLVFDLLFVTALVLVTRMTDSIFAFFFSVVIVVASIVLPRPGGLLAAAAATVMMVLVAVTQLNLDVAESFVESLGAPQGFLLLAAERAFLSEGTGIFYNVGLNVLAFFAVGLLTSNLMEQVRRARMSALENRVRLQALRALHANVVNSLPIALVTTDRSQNITFMNPVACKLAPAKPQALLGRPMAIAFPGLVPILSNPDKLSGAHSEQTIQVREGRRKHLQWTIAPLESAKGEPIGQLFIFQDVSRIVRMEVEDKRRSQLATVGQLAAGIAHEIRNPLTSISGSIQLLRSTVDLKDEERRLMDIVLRETDSLNNRISEFLAYARPREMDRRDTDLRELIVETVTFFHHDERSQERHLVLAEPWPEQTRALVDRDSVKDVLWNLLCNAADATQPGDTITAGLLLGPKDGEPHLTLFVADTGCGMPAEELSQATEPFFTTKEGGTGLGLATVKRTVEAHGGELRIESESGIGTRFLASFPVERYSDVSPPESVEEEPSTGSKALAIPATRLTGRP